MEGPTRAGKRQTAVHADSWGVCRASLVRTPGAVLNRKSLEILMHLARWVAGVLIGTEDGRVRRLEPKDN